MKHIWFCLIMLGIPVLACAQFGPGGDVIFDNGRGAAGIPFELNSDKIYLAVKINQKGPYWLVLDTGSPGMILDTRVANELGTKTSEGFDAVGAGEGSFRLAPADGVFDAELPGLRLVDQRAFIGGIDAIVGPYEGRMIDGVLGGYNVFVDHVVEIDYNRQTIGIHRRNDFVPPDGGTIVPVEVAHGHCSIEAKTVIVPGDTLDGEFILDTGLRGTVVYNTPVVDRFEIIEKLSPTV